MIEVNNKIIETLFSGEMGIKTVIIGDEIIYVRPGGYLYLELNTEEETTNG